MGRAVVEATITTRNARSKLPAGKTVHWRAIDRGAHLGYRKGKDGGTWVARHRKPDGTYVTDAIGKADDGTDADGLKVLSYSQAQKKARAWCEEQARHEAGRARQDAGDEAEPARALTVADAMEEYLAYLGAERKTAADARLRINAHILPKLGGIEVARLTAAKLREWLNDLAASPARVRTSKGRAQRFRPMDDEPETRRRRQAAANRVLGILKAALNRAYQDGKVPGDDAWRRVRPFRNADAPRIDYLTEDECRRLVNACPIDLRRIVKAALYTGCRYGELSAMRVGDFNPDTHTMYVRPAKSGKARHVVLTAEGAAFFAEMIVGRDPRERIFIKSDGLTWGRSHQSKPLAAAAKAAQLGRPITFHSLRHTHASHLAMAGTPLAVIAEQLGHADIRMASRHYAHLAPSYVATTIRANLPALGLHEPANVMLLRPTAS